MMGRRKKNEQKTPSRSARYGKVAAGKQVPLTCPRRGPGRFCRCRGRRRRPLQASCRCSSPSGSGSGCPLGTAPGPARSFSNGDRGKAKGRTRCSTGQDRTRYSTGQDRTGHGTAPGRTGQDTVQDTVQHRAEQDRTRYSTGQDRTAKARRGRDRTGEDRRGRDRTGHGTAPGRAGQNRTTAAGQDSVEGRQRHGRRRFTGYGKASTSHVRKGEHLSICSGWLGSGLGYNR